ncbi:MAG: F0F1 ATP synthase subunit epsilon [Desulfobacterales bacterium]|nr:F0F1 ATP synthase subunit epsilon [Desulfobacterales bacterium]
MAGKIRLEVVTPEGGIVNVDTDIVMAPGSLGEFGVLQGHTPFLTTLKIGTIRYKGDGGSEECVFVSGGFAEALPDKVTVLAESAERTCDIDVGRAREALERAKKRLAGQGEPDTDFIRAKAAMDRAMYRLNLLETGR